MAMLMIGTMTVTIRSMMISPKVDGGDQKDVDYGPDCDCGRWPAHKLLVKCFHDERNAGCSKFPVADGIRNLGWHIVLHGNAGRRIGIIAHFGLSSKSI